MWRRIIISMFLIVVAQSITVPALAQEESAVPNILEQLDQKPSVKLRKKPEHPAAQAQRLNQKKKAVPYKNYSEIPEEVIIEAELFFEDCIANYHRASHYNCECLSMRFLEERIISGPISHSSEVFLKIRRECPNMPEAAGYAYTACMGQSLAFFPKNQDPDQYCACVGNAYAKIFARAGQPPDSRHMTRMRVAANLSCIKQPPGVPPLVQPIQ